MWIDGKMYLNLEGHRESCPRFLVKPFLALSLCRDADDLNILTEHLILLDRNHSMIKNLNVKLESLPEVHKLFGFFPHLVG